MQTCFLNAEPVNEFKIPFVGLKNGKHHYEFDISDSFWQDFEYSPINNSDAWVELELTKQETMLILDFELYGTIKVPCDRCLEEFDMPIQAENRLIVKFGHEALDKETDEVLVLPVGDYEIDVKQYIYEFFNLALPMRKVHDDDEDGKPGCDPEVIKRIVDLSTPKHEIESDGRWDILKKLKDN